MKKKLQYVIVRTYSAGVHVGELEVRKGREVTLRNARRIWSWAGAFTLSEISQNGISGGRISCVVSEITLTEAIEIIPASQKAEECLRVITEYKP